jgi:Mn2+/Fe2+ NRAMP family transporter
MSTSQNSSGSDADASTETSPTRGQAAFGKEQRSVDLNVYSWIKKELKVLGPGVITGAADDDPSGIATYSSVGAQFGYAMLWTMPFIYPFMAAIQEISARIGRVTGRGIGGNLRLCYPRWILYAIVGLLVVANIINLGADIGAMGAAVNLLIGGPTPLYCIALAGISVILQVWIPYRKYATVLK